MINSMTVVLCNKLCAFGIFPKSQEKIYIYGFELLLSSVIGIMVLMMISITRGTAFAWLSYLLGFIPVRITGGGYHAKTHFTCILSFSLLFLIFLLSSSFIIKPFPNYISDSIRISCGVCEKSTLLGGNVGVFSYSFGFAVFGELCRRLKK